MRNGQTNTTRRRSSNTGLISSLLFPPSHSNYQQDEKRDETNMTSTHHSNSKKTNFPIVRHLLQQAKKHHQHHHLQKRPSITNDGKRTKKQPQQQQQQQQQHPNPNPNPKQNKEKKEEPIESKYLLTLNDEELERIQLKNDLVKLAFECEYTLPVDFNQFNNGRILDIGCGPGAWCLDIAEKYPSIQVIGIDCEDNMFPDPATIPKNCSFQKHNLLETSLIYQFDQYTQFDYIHIRFMNLSLTAEQYTNVVSDCWRLLSKGGYLELMEIDMTIYNAGNVTKKLNLELIQAAEARGFKPQIASQLSSLIPIQAIPIIENYRSMPIGVWGGRLGVLYREDMMNVMSHSQKAVSDHFGREETRSEHEIQHLLDTVSTELEQNRSYSNFYYKCVQKAP